MSFIFFAQLDHTDCGPICLKMIAKYYSKDYSLLWLRSNCFITREGVSLLGISDAAEKIGFRTIAVRIEWDQFQKEAPLPCIAHWKQNHFVVVYKITGKGKNQSVWVADPAHGLVKYSKDEFLSGWLSSKNHSEDQGVCLLLEPTPDFYAQEDEKLNKRSFAFLFAYLKPHHKYIFQLILGMILGSLLQLIFPFLTQAVVDKGINTRDLGFITLVLIAQLVLFFSQTIVEFIRSWILLHISTRINISLISDFLIKLMKLPIGFFDTKMIGDLMQRIGDHTRIESFLTSASLQLLFSMVNLVIFAVVLGIYSLTILWVFLAGSLLYALWVLVFMKRRRELDFKRFAQLSDNQSNLFQLITGMQEIKLNNCEKQKRWEWEKIQARLFKVNIKSLALSQYQQAGGSFFNQIKNILITFIAASSVVNGSMTLGMMMAVLYILGQLNAPIEQMIGFFRSAQDAKISLERLGEIHLKDDEEDPGQPKVDILPNDRNITISGLSFQYEGPRSPLVLKDLDLVIPQNKITAIVGTSGSGKTTLVKLLLGFYNPVEGGIAVGEHQLNNISSHHWRSKVGVVMQDGFIFSDSIFNNVAVSDEIPDRKKLLHAVKVANIQDYIESLPLSYNTKIGQEGTGLSQGQKQRILIARAVYKNPEYVFFDEATNALDANNEKVIMDNLEEFFKGRTVVVVAHRLSTVKNADQIVVLEGGKIVEKGNHKELTALQGAYYSLVKNQLELGN
ncbi:MAG: peptidase domain-containing ABC transporter [Bacteroidales bacterium]|nr:peptidase domain-containing ABC transporter [Bacteroidales bacterium]MDZ4204221.1 peptidase domain-containing ABC transporter [Bacteroidales bacterium]